LVEKKEKTATSDSGKKQEEEKKEGEGRFVSTARPHHKTETKAKGQCTDGNEGQARAKKTTIPGPVKAR